MDDPRGAPPLDADALDADDLDEGPVLDLDQVPSPETSAPPPPSDSGSLVIERDQETWEPVAEEGSAAPEEPRGWVYPVLGFHLDVTAPLRSTHVFTPSVGAELEGALGLTPFVHLGAFFRIGYGGLSTRLLSSDVDDPTPERLAILIGPRARVTAPSLWGVVTPFFDFTFGYQYLTVAVDDNEPDNCTVDVFGFEECTGEPTVLDRASRDARTIGLGGGLAFETHAIGDGDNGPDGAESLKVVLRVNYLVNEWLAGALRDRGADQLQVSLGAVFW